MFSDRVSSQDIMNQVRSDIMATENMYQMLFELNPIPMWMISLPERKFLAVNEAAIAFYGYTRDEFLQMNIHDIRPEEESNGFQKRIATYESGISNKGIWQHRKKDGTRVMVNIVSNDIIYAGRHAKLVVSNDMTEKIIAEEKLKHSHGELRQLATHLQTIRESERTRIAREIHDELGQQLTGMKMDLSWLNRKTKDDSPEVKAKLSEMIKLVDETVHTVRRIATQLRPSILDDLGLVAAMEWQSEEFQKRSHIKTDFCSELNDVAITPDMATAFFRIYQECLTNVMRHAKADQVTASLQYKNASLHLTVKDNGEGFNDKLIENKKTLGLLGMKERTLLLGGSFEISSKPGKGTTVVVITPTKNHYDL